MQLILRGKNTMSFRQWAKVAHIHRLLQPSEILVISIRSQWLHAFSIARHQVVNRPYFFAFMRVRDRWDICSVTSFLRGQTMNKICQYEFVYSVNTRRRFNSQDVQFEFRQVQYVNITCWKDDLLSLQLANKVTINTFTNNLPLASSR